MSFNEHKKILKDLKRFEAKVPQMVSDMGAIALNHYTMSFANQGFTDTSLVKWQTRKRTSYRTRSGKTVNDTTRGILIGKGTANLRKLRKAQSGRYTIFIKSNPVTNKYARVHNEGLRAGRGGGFQMPKRQFIGYSKTMSDKIIRMINKNIATL